MKKLICFFALLLLQALAYAQPPQGIAYQGVAYDSSGNPVIDQDIRLRISILNNSASGTVLYVETFLYHTNLQGVYSLNIGMGTVQTGTFNTINWGVGNKYLKAEIDITGGTNYTIIGTTQLMSVPYALYAGSSKKTENGVISVNTITDLKNLAVPAINEVVYVRCHSNIGDNGGGFFRWRNDAALMNTSPVNPRETYYTQDNNGTLIKSNVSMVGRWVREYDGFINIQFFGVDKDNAQLAIQRAIDFAYYNGQTNVSPGSLAPTKGSTVYVPSGFWTTRQIIMKNGVNLIGDTSESTIIAADKNDSSLYLVEMDKGPVRMSISNIKFYSSSESDIGCLHFKAEASTTSTSGGYWLGEFKNINIWGFRGHAIFSEGGTAGNYLLPNQFNVFQQINVNLARNAPPQTCALKMTGQHGQVTFLNCAFNGYNVSGKYHTGNVVNITSTSTTEKSAVISFINSTFQEGDYGLYIQNSENVKVDNCWFENVGDAVTVYGQNLICKAISIENSRFVNAAGYGTLIVDAANKKQGTCVHVVNSQVTVANNFVNVSNPLATIDDSFILASGLISGGGINEGVDVYGNSFGNISLSRTYGVRQGIAASGGVLNCRHNKLVIAQSGPITRIDSSVNAGEIIYVRASGSVTFNDTTNGTGNVFLTNRSSITLLANEVAAFMKIDNEVGNEFYQLVSLVKSSTP